MCKRPTKCFYNVRETPRTNSLRKIDEKKNHTKLRWPTVCRNKLHDMYTNGEWDVSASIGYTSLPRKQPIYLTIIANMIIVSFLPPSLPTS